MSHIVFAEIDYPLTLLLQTSVIHMLTVASSNNYCQAYSLIISILPATAVIVRKNESFITKIETDTFSDQIHRHSPILIPPFR